MSGAAGVRRGSCFVEASAGTGKTRELVAQIVEAICSGVAVDRVVAVTFTHAAAGEMKLRVRQELDRSGTKEAAAALQTLDRAFIGTIHSFCAQLLRQCPVEACVDPGFEELSQPEALAVFGRVFRAWIERKLADPPEALRRALARQFWRDEPIDVLRQAAWCLAEWRDYPCAWERRAWDRDTPLHALAERAWKLVLERNKRLRRGDKIFDKMQPIEEMVSRYRRASRAGVLDLHTVEGEMLRLPRPQKWFRRDAVVTAWEEFAAEVEAFRKPADADLAAALRDELWEPVELYGRAKKRAGQLDFLDLLIFARDLLRHPEARARLQQRYDRIFIDEFQDTDPLQAEILLLLCAGDAADTDWRHAAPAPEKLFVVGDPKQSIYRFRRADARLYREIHDALTSRGVDKRKLSVSHRSVDAIQQFVNAAFREMPDYLPLEGGPPAPVSQPAVVALPMPTPYKGPYVSNPRINECSPPAVAAFVEWLVRKSGWTVRERGERVPVQAKHVCVLFRRFVSYGVDLTQEYVRCLEAHGIDHVLVGSKSFHSREEIGTLRTALRAIEWPDDELSVYALLRGSLFSIEDGTLLKFWDQYKRFTPFVRWGEEVDAEFEPVRDALDVLLKLHRARNERPIADTVNALIEHTRAHASFAFRKGGARVLANVYRFNDLARAFEGSGSTSFRAFIDYLDQEAKSGETTEAPVLEQQAGGVKLMTVHKAKGLEFPVVILADMTAHLTGDDSGGRYVDGARGLCAQKLLGCAPWELVDHAEQEAQADRDEGVRLAYVAATRACDLLVVSALGVEQREDSWLAPLYDAVYPAKAEWRDAREAPGCPPMGYSTVLDCPPEVAGDDCVRPGLHRAQAGGHDVVWFDPKLLHLIDAKDQGLDRDELLQGGADAGLAVYQEWRSRRAAVIAAGSAPAVRVGRIVDLGAVREAESIAVETLVLAGEGSRPAGRNFGRLVHAVLQMASSEDHVEAVTRAQARKLRVGEPEIAAAIAAARRAMPLLAGGGEQFREMPVMLRLEDGTIAEGVIDLALFDGESWTVIDYKTGPAQQARYKRQLQLYGLALQRATNQPVKCLLVEV